MVLIVAIACEICSAPVARWQNMPGHYRRAHPDVLLPEAIARFGLQRSARPRLSGAAGADQRALPYSGQRALPRPGQRVQPRIQSGLGSDGRYVAALPGAVDGFVSVLEDDPVPVQSEGVAAPVARKPNASDWTLWAMVAGVIVFFLLQPEGKSSTGDAQMISGYQPEGVN